MLKKKQILSGLLSAALLLSAASCRPAEQTPGTTGGATSASGTQEPGGTSEGTEAPGSTEDPGTTEAPGTSEPGGEYAIPEDVIPDETVTLDVYTQLANYSGEQIGWFGQIMLEKFNVKLNIINEGDGTFATRMESGDLGDMVVFGNDTDQYQQAIKAGLLFDWEDEDLLSNYGTYIQENMAQALDKNRGLSEDGTLYGFGHNVGTSVTEHESFFYGPYVRWDLYKELGYPEVGTLEDFVPLLEQMVELQPESDTGGKAYGVSLFKDWDGDMVMFVKSTAALYGWDEFGFGLYNVDTQEYQDALQEDGMYLRMLKFYNTLFQKGLLDPDSMTQTYDDMAEDYQTGAAMFNIFEWMSVALYNTDEHKAEGKAFQTLAAEDQKNLVYGLNMNGGNRVWTIGAKTNYPELVMAIINWLSTPEGKMVSTYGPQGVTWDYDDQGRPFLTEFGETAFADQETEMTDGYTGKFTDGTNKINNQTWADDAVNPDASNGDTYNYRNWETRETRQVSEIEQDWRDHTGSANMNAYLKDNGHIAVSIGTTYTGETRSDELQAIWTQVAEAIKNYSWQAIYAKDDAEFDAIVAELITTANSYGYEQCVEFQQAQAERRAALEDEAKNY